MFSNKDTGRGSALQPSFYYSAITVFLQEKSRDNKPEKYDSAKNNSIVGKYLKVMISNVTEQKTNTVDAHKIS